MILCHSSAIKECVRQANKGKKLKDRQAKQQQQSQPAVPSRAASIPASDPLDTKQQPLIPVHPVTPPAMPRPGKIVSVASLERKILPPKITHSSSGSDAYTSKTPSSSVQNLFSSAAATSSLANPRPHPSQHSQPHHVSLSSPALSTLPTPPMPHSGLRLEQLEGSLTGNNSNPCAQSVYQGSNSNVAPSVPVSISSLFGQHAGHGHGHHGHHAHHGHGQPTAQTRSNTDQMISTLFRSAAALPPTFKGRGSRRRRCWRPDC